jgi:hypothetical protein
MTEMITGARTFVELPTPTPLGGGVLSVANVIDTSGYELMGVEALTDACSSAEVWEEWCTTTPLGRKIFEDTLDHVVGDPFAVYAGIACDLQRTDEAADRATARLGYAESRGVDFHVEADLASAAGVVDLGGPFSVAQGIGVAEAFAATVYGGVPTLLIPRLLVQCACENGALTRNLDGSLETCAGSKVAPLTTPLTVPVTVTSATLYVSGSVTVYRGPVETISVPQQVFDDGTFEPARALAERIYVPVFDCLVAKVDVTCS